MPHSNLNRVTLIGRLTKDPELRALPSGISVCNLRVACNGVRRDADGEYAEKPNFFDVAVFGGLAEGVCRYLRKGARVGIDGRLQWREWETDEGARRQTVSVSADTVEFLDGRGDGGEAEPYDAFAGDGDLDGDGELLAVAGASAGF